MRHMHPRKSSLRAAEAATLVAGFALFAHVLTGGSLTYLRLFLALCILAGGAVRLVVGPRLSRRAWAAVWGLAGGFWVFSLFRLLGLAYWPMAAADLLKTYSLLLISHAGLAATVVAAMLWASLMGSHHGTGRIKALIPLGIPLGGAPIPWRKAVLWLVPAGLWCWGLHHAFTHPAAITAPLPILLMLAMLKALITGFGEEAAYRGIVQETAIARYGAYGGLLVQATLYAAFHAHLGTAFTSSRFVFLGLVFALGLALGLAARYMRGIAWGAAVHAAFDLVIEWNNIS